MSSLAASPIMGMHRFDTDDSMLNTEVNANTDLIDTIPPTICTSASRPVSDLYTGRLIWETDTSRLVMWDGDSWENIAAGAWINFTPNVYTQMGGATTTISRTVNLARYQVVGKTCHAFADVTCNAGTAGGVGIDLPLLARDRLMNCGTLAAFGSGTAADQCGMAYMNVDKLKLILVAFTQGYREVISGNTLRYAVRYELP